MVNDRNASRAARYGDIFFLSQALVSQDLASALQALVGGRGFRLLQRMGEGDSGAGGAHLGPGQAKG